MTRERFIDVRTAVLWVAVLLLAVTQLRAVFTENVNWDEFALLYRARLAIESGRLSGGGRPGLGTLTLMPFASACRDAVAALVTVRLLWLAFVAGAVAAWWLLLRAILPPSPHRSTAIALGIGLWVLAPPFLRYSLQVRTDQPAILLGLLGGLALVASRRQVPLALIAGTLFGIGFLFTQKLVYVGLLTAVLAVAQLVLEREWRPRREVLRALLCIVAFAGVLLGYQVVATRTFGRAEAFSLPSGAAAFDYYRLHVAWRFYLSLAPALVPQLAVPAALLLLTGVAAARGSRRWHQLSAAWAVVAAGCAVLLFHEGRFPYFYLTLGLFPAAAGALLASPLLERARTAGARRLVLYGFWIPLAVLAVTERAYSIRDTQAVQRASLAFVAASFPPPARGFEGRGALACHEDPDPFPVRFNEHLVSDFAGQERGVRARALIEEFRSRPVSFMIPPIGPYPREVRNFWETRYVHYAAAVWIPGRTISADSLWRGKFEAIVPGAYTWHSAQPVSLFVDGTRLEPGASRQLAAGMHRLEVPASADGVLALAVPHPPYPDTTPFYRPF
jgi:hypothetical protein